MSPHRRISAALIGLLVLVIIGWVGRHELADPAAGPPSITGPRRSPRRLACRYKVCRSYRRRLGRSGS